ncbi:methyl-accepting chemotaxis protein [Paucibacter sp. R3-3]|uniref:Methyl-accepting chemotaxis protein n=1 Tax=Roseateles agri TaxID=3098619 RepID=A0ABU5DAY8_9BURK|nr:methyl-accepting chemotaxis protein [Paucibacter sp. R3-3]MDY0742893.1 methyl-accepting chemotaxis protein [Paucibacter sp. R3-3]
MLQRISVGAKLGLAFFVVLLITAVLGGLSIVQLGRVNDTATAMAKDWLPSTRVALQMGQLASRYRTREYRYSTSEAAVRPTELTAVKKGQESLEASIAAYDKLVSSDEEAAKYKEFKAAWADYLDNSRAMQAALDGGDEENARKLLTVSGAAKFDVMNKAIDALVEINVAGADAANDLGDQIFSRSRWLIIGMTAAAIALGASLAWLITRRITKPLSESVALAQAVAQGDLTRELKLAGDDELAQMQRALMEMVGQLRSVVSEVRSGVDSVSSASSQIATGNHDLSARTEQTASNLEETASSMEQLTGAVSQSADTARQANQLASAAAVSAQRGGEVVDGVVQRMAQISESSQRIADIIGTIDGIAFQTNILALNAAVEAARAGEQGRGFAVVASEVRALAQRSAEAAKEIKTLIHRSVETVEAGTNDVSEARRAMDEIVGGVRRVTDLMGEIAAAATEQRDGIGQVNQAVATLDQMTQQNAALVEESSAASASLKDQAQRLSEVVAVFKLRG